MAADGHLLFVWKPTGYELREQDGDVPSVGAEVSRNTIATFLQLLLQRDPKWSSFHVMRRMPRGHQMELNSALQDSEGLLIHGLQ